VDRIEGDLHDPSRPEDPAARVKMRAICDASTPGNPGVVSAGPQFCRLVGRYIITS
jgi:hypothetical protein